MSYEYKELIEQAIIDDDRPLDWEEGFKELDEVYAKAQAFDEIVDCLEKQVAYGLKDSEVLSEIDYLIRETFHNSKNNIYRRTEERSE